MYYFKVPVFTKLSRIQNIIVLFLQLIILIISILLSLYGGCNYESLDFKKGCNKYKIFPGTNVITSEHSSIWQFVSTKEYTSEFLTDFSKIRYSKIYNKTNDNHTIMKGNIIHLNKENTTIVEAYFRKFLVGINYDGFYYYFKNNVNMNNESYDVEINDGILNLMFYKNCSKSLNLIEQDGNCLFNNNTLNNINEFLYEYFDSIIVVPYVCHNCYSNGINSLDEAITVLSKMISIFILLNSFLIIVYIFILSKFKHMDIGYINDVININNVIKYNEIEVNDINEVIKN